MYWHIEDVVMKFLPPRNERRMSDCYWRKKPRGTYNCAALVLKNPSCLHGFLDTLSGLEELMEEWPWGNLAAS
jgi:hypothetical protein